MAIESVTAESDGPLFETERGRLKLQVIDQSVVRTVYTQGAIPDPESPMIVGQTPTEEWELAEREDACELVTDDLRVEVDRETAAITWRDGDGSRLVGEPEDGGKSVTPVDPEDLTVGDSEVATPRESLDREAYSTRLDLEFSDDEALLGLGQHDGGVANYRGESQLLYQGNTKVAMPALLSTRGYGMLWNTGSLTTFRDDAEGSYVWTECDDALDVFFVAGEDPDEVISGFRELTGESTLFPKWAYGYVQSKERYETGEELVDVVSEYRDRGIPIDCIVQDWQYWPDTTEDDPNFEEWGGPPGDWGRWGEKKFHPERYPDPSATIDELHERNVQLMISIWPNMLAGDNYDEMREAGHILDDEDVPAPGNEQRYYDAFSEEARDIYWNQAESGLFDHGVDAWWCDSTEPFDPTWTLPTEPDTFRLAKHTTDAFKHVLDPGYLNTYSIHQAKGMYEGQRAATDDKRVLNLTRSGYPGQQRYGAITWSGDIEGTWERYRTQIADGLQFTATGNPKWTLDIGGFFVHDGFSWITDGDYDDGHEDEGYRELYVRWFQYGAFLPMFRSHGTDTPREMWRFGEPGDRTYDTLVKFDRLRYRLLPYIYSLAGWETHRDYTMYRHLALEFPDDEAVHDVGDQFMLGPSVMACPVTEPMYYGPDSEPLPERAESREVYLPEGQAWYDFWSGERYEGGRTVLADAPLEKMPVFVKAGSVVPMGPNVDHTGEQADAPWQVRVYPGGDAEFDVYEDAGDGYDYEDGEYSVTPLRWDDAASEFFVGDRQGSFPELVEQREVEVVVAGEDGSGTGVERADPDATLSYDGDETSVTVDR